MTEIFIKIVNMSIAASYAALAVMIVRLFLNKAPKIFSYMLWSIVLLRLICPLSFESVYSLMPINTNTVPQDIIYVQHPAVNSGFNTLDKAVNTIINSSVPPAYPEASVNPMGIIIWLASILWIAGIIALLIYSLSTYLRLKQRLTTATLVHDNIYETDLIKSPFVLGFIQPKIYLPIGLQEKELDYILKHEKVHIKRRDYLVKPLAFLVSTIHWFNPVIWYSFVLMVKDMEMSCDESVIKQAKEDIRGSYSNSLLAMAVKQSRLISPLAFGENNTKSRVRNVLNYKRPRFWWIIIALAAVIGVGVGLLTNPINESIPVNNIAKAEEIYKYRTEYVGDNSKVVGIVTRLNIPGTFERKHVQLFTKEMPYGVEVVYKVSASENKYYSVDSNQSIFDQSAILMFALIGNTDYINFVLEDGNQNIQIQRSRDWANEKMGQNVWEASVTLEQFRNLYDSLTRLTNSREKSGQSIPELVEENLRIIMSGPKESSNPRDYIMAHQNEYEKLIKYGGEEALEYMLLQFEEGNTSDLRAHIMMELCKELLGQRNNVTEEGLSPKEWFAQLKIRQEINLPDFVYNGTDPIEKLVYQTEIERNRTQRGGFTIVAPHIFGSYEEDNKLKIFVTTFNSQYRLYDKVLSQEGGGVIPVALTFVKDFKGNYTLEKYEQAMDGSYFASSIKQFCTMPVTGKNIGGLADKILKHYGDYTDIRQLQRENLINHLKRNNQYGVSLYQRRYQKPVELIPLT